MSIQIFNSAGCKSMMLAAVAAACVVGLAAQAHAGVAMGRASSFAVLGASTVTNTGSTVLTGDLGLYPGTSITGFPPGTVSGGTYIADTTAQNAQTDAMTAYNYIAGLAPTQTLSGDLGGMTLTAGTYKYSSSAALTGILTLSGPGQFAFQIGSTLTTASASSIVLTNGATAGDVFFQVGSSATLGTTTAFNGTIIAYTSDTLDTSASMNGRVIALTGAVTLDTNNITVPAGVSVPTPASGALTVSGLTLLLAFGGLSSRLAMKKRIGAVV